MDPPMEGHPLIGGHFLRTVSYPPNVKEHVMKGYTPFMDTSFGILRCPLKTGFTVHNTVWIPNKYSL